jgi:hypothetical protein
MSSRATRRECHADMPIAEDDEETARLPSLSLETIDEHRPIAGDQIGAKLDELIALSRAINDHLESLAGKRKAPAWAPKNRSES